MPAGLRLLVVDLQHGPARLCHPNVRNGPGCFDIFLYQPAHSDRQAWHHINVKVPREAQLKVHLLLLFCFSIQDLDSFCTKITKNITNDYKCLQLLIKDARNRG